MGNVKVTVIYFETVKNQISGQKVFFTDYKIMIHNIPALGSCGIGTSIA